MCTEGISLHIVENATSDKLTKGDLKMLVEGLKKMESENKGRLS